MNKFPGQVKEKQKKNKINKNKINKKRKRMSNTTQKTHDFIKKMYST